PSRGRLEFDSRLLDLIAVNFVGLRVGTSRRGSTCIPHHYHFITVYKIDHCIQLFLGYSKQILCLYNLEEIKLYFKEFLCVKSEAIVEIGTDGYNEEVLLARDTLEKIIWSIRPRCTSLTELMELIGSLLFM
ncbi:16046_t:CDS:2, partial [Funneliformis mosseae]